MNIRKLVVASFLIALCFLGSYVKIFSTIAFDSMPGFLGTLVLGPVYGAIIGAIGHFLTAFLEGFPQTLPVHIIIMFAMAFTMVAFGHVYKYFEAKNKNLANILSLVTGTLVNGPLTMLILTPLLLPMMGKAGILAFTPILTLIAALNILLAQIIYKFLPKEFKLWK